MKLLDKKLKDATIHDLLKVLKIKDGKGKLYIDITTDCVFEPHCVGGSNDSRYGIDATYYDLGIIYGGKLLFKLDANNFKKRSIMLTPKSWVQDAESYKFHWLDNGSFMIVKIVDTR